MNFVRLYQRTNIINTLFRSKLNYNNTFILKKFATDSNVELNTNVVKDVILFKYENPKYFKLLNIFAVCQFSFWTYLSVFSLRYLKDAPADTSEDAPWWRKINLGENKYRNTITALAFLIGYGILSISWVYTLRSVRYLILRKGGKEVTIVTYGPFGKNRMFTLGLENISSAQMRSKAIHQVPLKVKGHLFHYILDQKGEFKNPKLFDHTAGLKRVFTK